MNESNRVENNSNPGQSQTYVCTPTYAGFEYVWKKYRRKTKEVKAARVTYCFYYLGLFYTILFLSLVVWAVLAAFLDVSEPDFSVIGLIFLFFFILSIVLGCMAPKKYYIKSAHDYMWNDPRTKLKQYVSFNGYHLVITSDISEKRIVISPTDKLELSQEGIYIQCLFGKEEFFFPIQTFGTYLNMMDFYARLTWNKRYDQIYK